MKWQDGDPLLVGDLSVSAERLVESLSSFLTPERLSKLSAVVDRRSSQVVPILENIYDRGNVSAVMRSCEAMGFYDFRIVERPGEKFKAANRVTAGTEKWLKISQYQNVLPCISDLRAKGYQVYATHLTAKSCSIDDVDFTKPTAFILGNEKDGVSDEALAACDGSFIIPMQGFAQSFNISVAGALCFYHAHLYRKTRMGEAAYAGAPERANIMANYLLRSVAEAESILGRVLSKAPSLIQN